MEATHEIPHDAVISEGNHTNTSELSLHHRAYMHAEVTVAVVVVVDVVVDAVVPVVVVVRDAVVGGS